MALLLRLTVLIAIVGICLAMTIHKPGFKPGKRSGQVIRGNRGNGGGKAFVYGKMRRQFNRMKAACREQPEVCKPNAAAKAQALRTRNQVAELDRMIGRTDYELTLRTVQAAKKAMWEAAGVPDAEPLDDGLWNYDLMLSYEQAKEILDSVEDYVAATKGNSGARRRVKRGYALGGHDNVKYWFNQKGTIYYKFISKHDYNFTEHEKDLIRSQFPKVTQAVPCITFEEDANAEENVIYIQKISGSCGGWANFGRTDGRTNVALHTCYSATYMSKVMLHELMHVLGVDHEHERLDRDSHITFTCNWIEQGMNYMVLTVYDLSSTTHYEADTCGFKAIDPSLQSEIAKGFTNGELTELDKKTLKVLFNCQQACPDSEYELIRQSDVDLAQPVLGVEAGIDNAADCIDACTAVRGCRSASWTYIDQDCYMFEKYDVPTVADANFTTIRCRTDDGW